MYSVNSFNNYFWNHTNEEAEDFKIEKCKNLDDQKWEDFVSPKDEVLVGSLFFLENWILRSETANALTKLFVRKKDDDYEEEIKFTDEIVIEPGISFTQKDRNTNEIYISYSSPKTQTRVYLYNLLTKEKSL